MTDYPVLTIRSDKPTGKHSRIWLGNIEKSHFVRDASVSLPLEGIATANLEIIVRPDVEIPVELHPASRRYRWIWRLRRFAKIARGKIRAKLLGLAEKLR